MDFNFSRAFGETFKVESFSNIMKFIHAYNETKERIGSTNEAEIIAAMRGYDPISASRILSAIKGQFGQVPLKENEADFMSSYYTYMQKVHAAQRQKVIDARKSYNEKKTYEGPNGVKYSSKELAEAGAKAKKKARGSKWARFAVIALGAVLGSYLVPLLLTTVFTGVAAVSTLSALSMIGSIAGLVGGGILGARIYNGGGRKERLKANDALSKFWSENQDAILQEQSQLEAEEAKLREIESDFGLELNEDTGLMDSEEFHNIYNTYTTAPLVSESETVEPEVTMVDEDEISREPEATMVDEEETASEASSETEGDSADAAEEEVAETEEPIIYDDEEEVAEAEEPVIYDDEEEVAEAEEPEVYADEEEVSEAEEPEVYADEEEVAEAEADATDLTDIGVTIPPVNEYTSKEIPVSGARTFDLQNSNEEENISTITEDQKKKIKSALAGSYTKAINVCSAVGRYMLIDSREYAFDRLEQASNANDIEQIVGAAKAELAEIRTDYRKYVANQTSNNVTGKNVYYLEELPENSKKKGKYADEAELPVKFTPRNGTKQLCIDMALSYVKQGRTQIDKYLKAKYSDSTPAEKKERAQALYEKAEQLRSVGVDFKEVDEAALEFQREVAENIGSVSVTDLSTTTGTSSNVKDAKEQESKADNETNLDTPAQTFELNIGNRTEEEQKRIEEESNKPWNSNNGRKATVKSLGEAADEDEASM